MVGAYRFIGGVTLVVYGIVKIAIAMASLYLPQKYLPFKADHTDAGLTLELILLVFGFRPPAVQVLPAITL